jgi:hypothetical protein
LSAPFRLLRNDFATYNRFTGLETTELERVGYSNLGSASNIHILSNTAEPDTRYDDEIKRCISVAVVVV